jgi:hypothetical protein
MQEIAQHSPAPRGTRSRPQPASLIHADGKVLTPLLKQPAGTTRTVDYVDTETGEITVEKRLMRTDPDAKTHIVGDSTQVHDSKFWHCAWRGDRPHERVILDVAHVPGVKNEANSEADIAVRELKSLALPDEVLGVLADKVLRGTHIDELQRDAGLLVISPVAADRIDPNSGARIEKDGPFEQVTFAYPDGTSETVDIWHRAGRACQRIITGDAEVVLQPLERLETQRRSNSDGTYRFYDLYRVPDPRGGSPKTIRLRTYTNDDDRPAGFTGPRTSARSHPETRATNTSMDGARTPSPSIAPSTTTATSSAPAASVPNASFSICSATPSART